MTAGSDPHAAQPARQAPAKVNLALLVGPRRDGGYHDVCTVMQPIALCDRVRVERAPALEVHGFADDTIVRYALERLAAAAAVEPGFSATIAKAIPVAAGLGGGSSDAAAALLAANELLQRPLAPEALHEIASGLGADVPFFLAPGAKLAEGIGERLTPLELPSQYTLVLARDPGVVKPSTGEIYRRFDEAGGGSRFQERRQELLASLAAIRSPQDLARLPGNDLAGPSGAAALVPRLLELGAVRADVSGAGPTVYGIFATRELADAAAGRLAGFEAIVTSPIR